MSARPQGVLLQHPHQPAHRHQASSQDLVLPPQGPRREPRHLPQLAGPQRVGGLRRVGPHGTGGLGSRRRHGSRGLHRTGRHHRSQGLLLLRKARKMFGRCLKRMATLSRVWRPDLLQSRSSLLIFSKDCD